jgi:hypothetical protein
MDVNMELYNHKYNEILIHEVVIKGVIGIIDFDSSLLDIQIMALPLSNMIGKYSAFLLFTKFKFI